MAKQLGTPRRAFATAGAASLASTAPVLGPGGCPYEATLPRWLQGKTEKPKFSEPRPTIIFVIGGPGADKDTYCARLAREFRCVHLSVVELLKEECARPNSDVAAVLEEYVLHRQLVPVEIVVDLVMKAIEQVENYKQTTFLLEGFPRTMDQLEGFMKLAGSNVVAKSCVFFDCRDATAEQRLLAKAISESASEDEAREVVKQRVAKFREAVLPVQRHFQNEGLLERIDASREFDKVWIDVLQHFIVDVFGENGEKEGSPSKAIWKLREKQVEEIFPTGHAHTSISLAKGPDSRGFTSYGILTKHRDKHTRNMRSPVENFTEPMTLAQQIGWHQADDGNHIGAKGTPRGMTTPRSFYPKSTCAMTRHLENMYSTNAQNIIRRW